MTDPFMARCGFDCSTCECREQAGCPGCPAAEGKMFWGECAVARCCISRNHEHCGQCPDFPCSILNEYSHDPEHGDGGQRIRNLEGWNEMGFDAWRRRGNESQRAELTSGTTPPGPEEHDTAS